MDLWGTPLDREQLHLAIGKTGNETTKSKACRWLYQLSNCHPLHGPEDICTFTAFCIAVKKLDNPEFEHRFFFTLLDDVLACTHNFINISNRAQILSAIACVVHLFDSCQHVTDCRSTSSHASANISVISLCGETAAELLVSASCLS